MFRGLPFSASKGYCCRRSCRVLLLHFSESPVFRARYTSCLLSVFCKALARISYCKNGCYVRGIPMSDRSWIHSSSTVDVTGDTTNTQNAQKNEAAPAALASCVKVKRKKLKGKRAVVRWLKQLRFKKMKEYQRMTAEEKIQYKLNKARRKEERLVTALNKLEPKHSSESTHDPEILTPEEHFFFLKMGLRCRNYVPVGRRGIYQGVILNMHLHWKKHQTLQVIVKTFTPEEVRELAADLARLSGGIVLDIVEENTIIMYRGKNYAQPPTEIMSPRITLSRRKALDKSKYLDALRSVRRYIPRLQREMKMLQVRALENEELTAADACQASAVREEIDRISPAPMTVAEMLSMEEERAPKKYKGPKADFLESSSDVELSSDTDISDVFETESESDGDEPLYMDQLGRFSVDKSKESVDFGEQVQELSTGKELDEVDLIFLRAASLLKKKPR